MSGKNASTAACIFDKINETFTDYGLPWENCVSLTVDNNTNAMTGRKNSIASRFKQKNESCFIGGCPCHLDHIAASNANDALSQHIRLNVEDAVVDLFYWFEKSNKRKAKLKEYHKSCNQEYREVLKYLSVSWLSLEKCINKAALKHIILKLNLESEHFADERFERLLSKYSNPLLELAMLFQTSALPLLTYFNMLLQHQEPTIHILKSLLEAMSRRLAMRIMKTGKLREITAFLDIDLESSDIFKHPETFYVAI